jgi:hypothetical protein
MLCFAEFVDDNIAIQLYFLKFNFDTMQHKPTFAVPKNKVLPKDGAWEREFSIKKVISLSPIKS